MKEVVRTAAQQEHYSITNMVLVKIHDYCECNDITIPGQGELHRNGSSG